MSREEIKRATQRLSITERNGFYAMIKRTDKEQTELVDYVKSLREPIFFDDYVPSPVLPIEERY